MKSKDKVIMLLVILICIVGMLVAETTLNDTVYRGGDNMIITDSEPTSMVKDYQFIVIYLENDWGHGIFITDNNGTATSYRYSQVTKFIGFETWKKLIDWINSSNYAYYEGGQKRVRVEEDDLIAIYDLSKAEKIEMKLTEKEVVIKEHIEIEEEKWTDKKWILEEEK